MKDLTDRELLAELRLMRACLDPVLNARMKNVLSEADRRLRDLSGSGPKQAMTKEQILNKWLNKY